MDPILSRWLKVANSTLQLQILEIGARRNIAVKLGMTEIQKRGQYLLHLYACFIAKLMGCKVYWIVRRYINYLYFEIYLEYLLRKWVFGFCCLYASFFWKNDQIANLLRNSDFTVCSKNSWTSYGNNDQADRCEIPYIHIYI